MVFRLHGFPRKHRAAEHERLGVGVKLAPRADVLAGALEHSPEERVVVDHQPLALDGKLQVIAHVLELAALRISYDGMRVRHGLLRGSGQRSVTLE